MIIYDYIFYIIDLFYILIYLHVYVLIRTVLRYITSTYSPHKHLTLTLTQRSYPAGK